MCSQSGMEEHKHICGIQAHTDGCNSDGIARVHGMNNVQAEELVE